MLPSGCCLRSASHHSRRPCCITSIEQMHTELCTQPLSLDFQQIDFGGAPPHTRLQPKLGAVKAGRIRAGSDVLGRGACRLVGADVAAAAPAGTHTAASCLSRVAGSQGAVRGRQPPGGRGWSGWRGSAERHRVEWSSRLNQVLHPATAVSCAGMAAAHKPPSRSSPTCVV
jgi:hypothetical protein